MDRLKSKIHEVIVTTLSAEGQPHHAPMGISEVNGHFQIKPFKPSATYDNLKRSSQCCINYIDDVRVFAGALTGRRQWPGLVEPLADATYFQQLAGPVEATALGNLLVQARTMGDLPAGTTIRDVARASSELATFGRKT